jgi:elongation factor Ts
MQIAAMNPIAIDKDGVDQNTIEREIAIAKEQIIAEGNQLKWLRKLLKVN